MDKELYKLVVDEIDLYIGDDIAYCDRRDCAKAVVERLEDEGYRRLNDDDIVLTKAMQDGGCEGMDDRTLEFFKKHNSAVRKETAREFKQTMKDIFRFVLRNKGNTSIPYFNAEELVFAKFDKEVDREFLQEYGVEVDE